MSACQFADPEPPSRSLPWSGDPRAEDKGKLFRYIAVTPEGTPLACIVRDVFGEDTPLDSADAALARRFYRSHPDLFVTDRHDGLLWIEDTGEAGRLFNSTPNQHSPKIADGDGVRVDTPKVNTENALGRRRTVESDGVRGDLLGALAAKRQGTEDTFLRFDRERGDGPPHLLVPFRTRFNSPKRVAETREAFGEAFARAARRYDRAVLLTLTTDPARFDSLADATAGMFGTSGDLPAFKSWYANRFGGGTRPPSVVVPEFTDRGVIHLHVVLFGVGFVPHAALSHYWDARRDRGSVVWVDALESDGERWAWAGRRRANRKREDVGSRGPRAYLGKHLADLASLAAAPPADVHEAAQALRESGASETATERDRDPADGESGGVRGRTDALARGRRWWRLALYFATDVRLFTLSPSLRPSAPDRLPHVPRYRFVSAARYGQFPAHVRRNARVVTRRGRPPPEPEPPPSESTGART